MAQPLFRKPEASLAGLGEWSGFLLVGLKMADKKGGKKNLNQLLLPNRRTVKEGLISEI
jgi:hypothetical protein